MTARAAGWRHPAWVSCAGLVMIATGCSPAVPTTSIPEPTPRAASRSVSTVSASVRVVPAASAELGFLISAPVKQVLVAEGDMVTAGQELVVLDAPQLEHAVKAADAAYTSAERDEYIQSQGRRKWNGEKYVWVAGPPEQRRVARARVLQAQAGQEVARAQLEQSILRAPFDGTVVLIQVRPGEVVQPLQVVAALGDLARLQLETTDLSEADIGRVRLGQRVSISLDALAASLAGSVADIDPIAGRSADGDVTFRATIELEAPPSQLLWGMTGEAQIQVDG